MCRHNLHSSPRDRCDSYTACRLCRLEPSSTHAYTKSMSKHIHHYYSPSVTRTHTTHIISSTSPTNAPHCHTWICGHTLQERLYWEWLDNNNRTWYPNILPSQQNMVPNPVTTEHGTHSSNNKHGTQSCHNRTWYPLQ